MEMLWTTDNRQWYRRVYLKSDHWRELRAAKLKANPVCEKCLARPAVEPHHLRYKQIFDVLLSDLLSVCRVCHSLIHREEGMPKRVKPRQNHWPEPALRKLQEQEDARRAAVQLEREASRRYYEERARVWTKEERNAFCKALRAKRKLKRNRAVLELRTDSVSCS